MTVNVTNLWRKTTQDCWHVLLIRFAISYQYHSRRHKYTMSAAITLIDKLWVHHLIHVLFLFSFYTLTSVCVHFMSAITDHKQTEGVWSLSRWTLLLSIGMYMENICWNEKDHNSLTKLHKDELLSVKAAGLVNYVVLAERNVATA